MTPVLRHTISTSKRTCLTTTMRHRNVSAKNYSASTTTRLWPYCRLNSSHCSRPVGGTTVRRTVKVVKTVLIYRRHLTICCPHSCSASTRRVFFRYTTCFGLVVLARCLLNTYMCVECFYSCFLPKRRILWNGLK